MTTGIWLALAGAIILDAIVGDPEWLWQRTGHPVTWIGRLIAAFDRQWNRDGDAPSRRRQNGAAAMAILVVGTGAIGLLLSAFFATLPFGWLMTAVVVAVLLAGRSLVDHVRLVADELRDHGLAEGRRTVARIVGRDPESLDESGVARAAIESAAESFSDGLLAPALWFALAGLPGIMIYKAVNTADSMIGHLDDRYRDFGWAAARLDDVLNWPAARLSALLIALSAPIVGGRIGRSLRVAGTGAGHHASPNAGWPEAAMAGALDLRLGGPRSYDGEVVDTGTINPGGRSVATELDIRGAVRIVIAAEMLMLAATIILAILS